MYFDSEEEARKYINDNLEDKRMADITHINDKFVTGYSEVGELMALGIKEAAEFYNMKVEFDGDYQLGFCWKDCH